MTDATTAAAESQHATIADDDETRKHLLIARICIYRDRIAALDQLMEEDKAALRLLMKRGGDTKRTTDAGTASIYSVATYAVHDAEQLGKLFSKRALAEAFKPTKAFVEAAKKAKVSVSKAITEGADERFKVERRRTKAARERQDRIIEETKREAQTRIERLARIMLTNKAK